MFSNFIPLADSWVYREKWSNWGLTRISQTKLAGTVLGSVTIRAFVRQCYPRDSYETETSFACADTAAFVTSCANFIRNGQAFRDRVLLQDEVGTCAGVSAVVEEEPLSAAQKASGDGADAQSLDGSAALPHDRRRALGFPRDHRVQELGGSE